MRPTYCPFCGKQLLELVEFDYISYKYHCPSCGRYMDIQVNMDKDRVTMEGYV